MKFNFRGMTESCLVLNCKNVCVLILTACAHLMRLKVGAVTLFCRFSPSLLNSFLILWNLFRTTFVTDVTFSQKAAVNCEEGHQHLKWSEVVNICASDSRVSKVISRLGDRLS